MPENENSSRGVTPGPQPTKPLDEGTSSEKHLTPGRTLANRFFVEKVIGVGGMGSVYRARDLHFPSVKKLVAIKEMANQTRDAVSKDLFIRNFEREANVIALLNHPAIPRIYDFFEEDDNAYLVLEYIHGKDLETLIHENGKPFRGDEIISWAIQLCEVLHYLHTHKPEPIIFRDVKPSNIMINQYNKVILVDFGIAKAFRLGQKGTMMGTEGYSPPEQYRGEASPLVDIYALGATLHHMLTFTDPQDEPPFTFSERPIQNYNPDVSSELITVINKALSYDAQDRFQSAEEMRTDLLALSGRTRTASLPKHTLKGLQPTWSFECEDEIRGTPAYDSGCLYIGSCDHNLYALDAANGQFIWKYPTRAAIVSRPAVSDRIIYIGSEDHEIHVVYAGTGKPLWKYQTDGRIRSSIRLTEGYLFVGSDDGYLYALNLRTGSRLWRFHVGFPIRSTPLALNNLIFFGAESGDFYCLDVLGEPKWHFHARRAVTSSPTASDRTLYFGSMDAALYSIVAVEGWEAWRFRLGKGTISSPYCADGLVYIGAIDGLIYAIDQESGRDVWKYQTNHQVTGSPVVYNNRLYCGSVDGNMYCLESRTGREIWKFPTGSPITGSPIIADEMLYFGSTNHWVYALPV